MLSRRCNIECRHCGIESSPHVQGRMSVDDARQLIVEAAAIDDFAKVTFTGGEPTLFRRDLRTLIAFCRDLGLSTRIVTNGGWAARKDRGLAFLSSLREAGLSELNFSADKFHLEFLPSQTLRNALDCARQLGYSRIVSFVSNAERDPLQEFSDLYGVRREKLIDLRLALARGISLDALKEDFTFVFYGGLIGLGRAARFPADLRYYPIDFFPAGSGCREVVNKPVIYPDGTFQACCCAGGKVATFTVGNAFEEDVASLYDRMTARLHFKFINDRGPRSLYEAINDARPDLGLASSYTSICEMCVRSTEQLSPGEVDEILTAHLTRELLDPFTVKAGSSPSTG
jgi:organic radical activating enzyme